MSEDKNLDKNLVPREDIPSHLQQYRDNWDESSDQLDHVRPSIPEFSIVTPTSKVKKEDDSIPTGQYYFDEMEKVFSEILIVPLVVMQGKSLFLKSETGLVCASSDGIKSTFGRYQGSLCEECPGGHNKIKKGDNSPECANVSNMFAYALSGVSDNKRVELGKLSLIRFKRAGEKALSTVKTLMFNYKLPMYSFVFSLKTKEIKSKSGIAYHVPSLTFDNFITEQLSEKVKEALESAEAAARSYLQSKIESGSEGDMDSNGNGDKEFDKF
jgi:hypothetical protein